MSAVVLASAAVDNTRRDVIVDDEREGFRLVSSARSFGHRAVIFGVTSGRD